MSGSGWILASLADVLARDERDRSLVQGWSPQCERVPAMNEEDWAVLKTTAIQDGRFVPSENKRLPSTLSPRPELTVRSGDLLVTCAGPRRRCGVPCLVEKDQPKRIISGKMYRFRADGRIAEPKYLLAALRSQDMQTSIDAAKTGISDSGLNLTHDRFLQLQLPIGPLPEQRRIVAKIENLSAKSGRARDYLDHIPLLVEKYKLAILSAAFDGRLLGRSFDSLPRVALGALVDFGPQNGLYLPKSQYGSGVPILRIQNYDFGGAEDISSWQRVAMPEKQREDFALRDGDLIINRVNSPSHLGKSLVVRKSMEGSVFESNMMRLSLKAGNLVDFVHHYLISPEGRRSLVSDAKWAVNQASINQGDVLRVELPALSVDGQGEIVRRIEAAFTWTDRLAKEATSARKLVDHLDQAVLAKAFRGELVPQDPSDEPAGVLLDRIRAEREGSPTAPSRRGRRAAG